MKTSFHFLILLTLFISSPYDQLSTFISVQASNPNSNGGMFTVDLIHRDSLLSPQERLDRLPFTSAYKKNKGIQTEVIPSDGDYLMKISIGNPPYEFMGVADTGSDLIWVQCSGCKKSKSCIPQKAPFFNPKKSSTYQTIPCKSTLCSDSGGACPANSTSKNCVYYTEYGDGTASFGDLSTETISFPSAKVSLNSAVFGCGYLQIGSVSKGEGIVGLGGGPLSLVSQLGSRINHKFSYCLVPLNSGATSKLRFGADVIGHKVVSTPLVKQEDSTFYVLKLDGISIGKRSVPAGQNVIIDSGSTFSQLDPRVHKFVTQTLIHAIAHKPSSDPDLKPLLCYKTKEALHPPNVVFHFKGADVVLRAGNLFTKVKKHFQCLAIFPTNGTSLFGNIAQVNFEVGYDLKAKRVSFAPRDCATF